MSEIKITDADLDLIRKICLPYKLIGHSNGLGLEMKVSRLLRKFGVDNRAALVVKALKLGLVTLDQLQYRDRNK